MIARAFSLPSLRMNAILGGVIVGGLAALAVTAPWLAPRDPLALDLSARMSAPGQTHLLGTDEFGRDMLSRLLFGARTSVIIAFFTVLFALATGTVFGTLAGFMRGYVDRIVMMFNDAFLAFPGLLLALGLMAVFGASRDGIIIALGLAYMPVVVRVVRATVMSIREREYVEASRVMGNSEYITMLRHVLPNCIAPVTVLATTMFGWVVLSESALSFLGLGVPPPAPSWGNMLSTARPFISQAPHMVILPGLCIAITLLGVNMLGDAIRDWLDPKMKA
ncbi:binding-protein-dependent transport systems inner membrane component [Nitratireductor aquibiodomus RA22]|uniref:Binding-protein-dependent transport systems inner membrane component n=1 Tax=Nitratireductor aquibiodomus RA22 TaxID=1189611 RepID=I5BVD9_9HYPH|nr:ABC transporter permease [Nitratireductor aquibiodomus]EIM73541.1 binding-protein-dependent transport systems inner membrane component [Nitratireductor aquibiodomus RA22]